MKYVFFIFSLLVSVVLVGQNSNESFNVIRVNGNIFNVTESADLQQGNSFRGEDEMKFMQKSYAYVISDLSQKFMLRTPSIESADADIFSNADMALTPIRSRGQLSTRGAVSETGVKDFKTYLGNDNFSVIGSNLEIAMDSNRYPLNNEEFIVFYYKIAGEEVSKKVAFDQQVLRFEKDKLKESKGIVLASDTLSSLSVYSYNTLTKESSLITEINLCFLSSDELKSELDVIVPILKKQMMPVNEMKSYLKEYIIDIYGNMDETQLESFIANIKLGE